MLFTALWLYFAERYLPYLNPKSLILLARFEFAMIFSAMFGETLLEGKATTEKVLVIKQLISSPCHMPPPICYLFFAHPQNDHSHFCVLYKIFPLLECTYTSLFTFYNSSVISISLCGTLLVELVSFLLCSFSISIYISVNLFLKL